MNKTDIKKLYILSAAIPVLVMWIAFAAAAVFPFNPFGDRQILISDLWQQYFPFISVYWHYLRAGQIPLWSWHAGGGHDYIAHIAYYMASPFNLLAALFPHSWLRDILTIFLTFKIGLAGLFMCIFLRHITRRDDYMLAVFSALFALCGFSLAYHWNIMWMDTFAIFPIVMLGVHFLVTQGRWRLFTISLALSIIFNFYIGFFVCVFVGFLFFILAIANRLDWRAFLRRFALIAACSAIAIGMTAFIALPTFMALQHTFNAVNDINTWPANPRFYTSFFNTLGNFLPFNPSTTGHPPDVLPYFYSGMISLMFFPIFMMSKKVLIREKIAWGLVVIFMIISANHNGLNFIWHGFSFTHSLPFRYVFLISFSMVIMAARAYFLLEKIGWREIVAMAAGGGFFILMGAFGRQTDAVVIWSGVLLVVYIGIITILWKIKGMEASGLKGRKKSTRQAAEPLIARTKQLAPVALAGIILIELGIATVVFVDSNRTTGRDFPWLHANTQEILALRDIGENDFARTEFSRWWSTNDPSLYGYHGLTFFSSMVREDAGRFLQGLGLVYRERANSFAYAETSPVTDAFLNMRYMIHRTGHFGDQAGKFWEIVDTRGQLRLMRNTRALPLGFMVNEAMADYRGDRANPFNSQNDLWRLATGISGNLFTITPHTHSPPGENRVEFPIRRDGCLYIFARQPGTETLQLILINADGHERDLGSVTIANTSYLFRAGSFEAGQIIALENADGWRGGAAVIFGAFLNHDIFDAGFDRLSAETLNLTYFSNHRIRGNITTQGGLLYTSIPHGGLWRAFVNGEAAEIISIDGSMLALRLPPGHFEIELRFRNTAFLQGAAISAVSLAAFLIPTGVSIVRKKLNKGENPDES